MHFDPFHIYHIYNQGNNKQVIFHDNQDYDCFLELLQANILTTADVISYCLMPNHFHLLIHTDQRCNEKIKQGGLLIDPLTNGIRKLLSSYARLFNIRYQQSGSIFRQKTKSNQLSASLYKTTDPRFDYYYNCFHYIHQNPVKAGFVRKMEDWKYSSFCAYAGLNENGIINKRLATKFCSYNPEIFYTESYLIRL